MKLPINHFHGGSIVDDEQNHYHELNFKYSVPVPVNSSANSTSNKNASLNER